MVSASRTLTELKSEAWVLVGPTGVGKSRIALKLAQSIPNLELINVDSVSFYRDFNIGSAKPNLEEQNQVPHHLIDVAAPEDSFTAADFLRETNRILSITEGSKKRVLFVGGSGFYLKGLLFGLWDAPGANQEFRESCEKRDVKLLHNDLLMKDPSAAARIGGTDRYRLTRALELLHLTGIGPTQWEQRMPKTIHPLLQLVSLDQDPKLHASQLKGRIETMLRRGLIEEVTQLIRTHPHSRALQAVGYRQVVDYLSGTQPQGRPPVHSEKELVEELWLAHRQLSKAQRTWIKGLKPLESFLLPDQEESLIQKGIAFYRARDRV